MTPFKFGTSPGRSNSSNAPTPSSGFSFSGGNVGSGGFTFGSVSAGGNTAAAPPSAGFNFGIVGTVPHSNDDKKGCDDTEDGHGGKEQRPHEADNLEPSDSFFEIKIAVLGNVSAGKTTLLNALFCDKFGEVSMKRTTAGINFFRIHSIDQESREKDSAGEADPLANKNDAAGDPKTSIASRRSAESILKEITDDNVKLRKGEEIQEKVFDIELKKDLFPMRKDTKLVFVDIPGINEANTTNKYKNYVAEMWNSFDGVLVVMDARQGVNTEDQVSLLQFVKEQEIKKKKIPIIVLCNKVDDPEDEEQAELVKEARHEVEKIFGSKLCREKALGILLDLKNQEHSEEDEKVRQAMLAISQASQSLPSNTSKQAMSTGFNANSAGFLRQTLSPTFIPVSAIHAFIHQSASLMTRERFDNFDSELLEKLGREQIGRRRWNRLSEQEKRDEAFKVVKEGYQDGMVDSNFDKLLATLGYFFGGDKTQFQMIELQIRTGLDLLSKRPFPHGGITFLVRGLYQKRKLLHASRATSSALNIHGPNLDLVQKFWTTFQAFRNETLDSLKADFPESIHRLADLMDELVRYHDLTNLIDWNDTSSHVTNKMKETVKLYIAFLLKMRRHELSIDTESKLTSQDWLAIWSSFLLLSYSKVFCQTLGQEKMIIEGLVQEINMARLIGDSNRRNHRKCPRCEQNLTIANAATSKTVIESFQCCRSCMKTYSIAPHEDYESRTCPSCEYCYPIAQWSGDICPRCRQPSQFVVKGSKNPLVCPDCNTSYLTKTCTTTITDNIPFGRCSPCKAIYFDRDFDTQTWKTRCCGHCGYNYSDAQLKQMGGNQCPNCRQAPDVSHHFPERALHPVYTKAMELIPFPNSHKAKTRIQVPEYLSDKTHIAHIAWKYCEFVESLDQNK
mmetsp:Transcript_1211/g.2378  ORF Transcript_1211/g.2378 Transcript_1211/m.2378 type:complete len:903 (+) Transcript_1211:97-2805(+)